MARRILVVLLILTAGLSASIFFLGHRSIGRVAQTSSGIVTSTYSIDTAPAYNFLKEIGYSRVERLQIQEMQFDETKNAGYVLTNDDGSILVAAKLDSASDAASMVLKVYMDSDIKSKSSEWAVNIFLLSGLLQSSPSQEKSLIDLYPDMFRTQELGNMKLVSFK